MKLTEFNFIFIYTAFKSTRLVIVSKRVSIRARLFEILRVRVWFTLVWVIVSAAAAAFIGIILAASGLAADDVSGAVLDGIIRRALGDLAGGRAAAVLAVRRTTLLGVDRHGQIVSVDQADIVEILAVHALKEELCERGWVVCTGDTASLVTVARAIVATPYASAPLFALGDRLARTRCQVETLLRRRR